MDSFCVHVKRYKYSVFSSGWIAARVRGSEQDVCTFNRLYSCDEAISVALAYAVNRDAFLIRDCVENFYVSIVPTYESDYEIFKQSFLVSRATGKGASLVSSFKIDDVLKETDITASWIYDFSKLLSLPLSSLSQNLRVSSYLECLGVSDYFYLTEREGNKHKKLVSFDSCVLTSYYEEVLRVRFVNPATNIWKCPSEIYWLK